jgi:hypothetical protein
MGLQPQEQLVLPTMLRFVQAAAQAGLLMAFLARPTSVLVLMGWQRQDQVVLQEMLQYAQVAMQDFISTVLLARLAQQDAVHAKIPQYV